MQIEDFISPSQELKLYGLDHLEILDYPYYFSETDLNHIKFNFTKGDELN